MTISELKSSNSEKSVIRVLIADDHPVVRAGLRAMLKARGIEVVGEAASGEEACERARELTPDVVLMDVRMPGMDGLVATRHIKRDVPDTAVLLISSFESKDYLRGALEAGGSGYLLKGMSRDTLIQAIRLAGNGGCTIDGEILAELLTEIGTKSSNSGSGPDRCTKDLSPRDREVLGLIAQGLTNKEIAGKMGYSVGTVKNAVRSVVQKLGVSDRTQAAVVATKAGLGGD